MQTGNATSLAAKCLTFTLASLLSACATLDSQRSDLPPASPEASQPKVAKVERSSSTAAQSLLLQADVAAQQGDTDLAVAHLERAMRIAPHDARIFQRLSRVYLQRQERGKAEQMALKGLAVAKHQGANPQVVASLEALLDEARR